MLVITDLKNETYALLAQKNVKKELNGSQELQLIVHQQKNNSLDLKDISEMWTLTYQNIDYKIVYLEQITRGHSFYLSIRAVPLFYDEFSTSIIHYREDGSVTAVDCFERIFSNTSFNYRLVNSRSAKTWDNFGNGENRWNLFSKAINKFNLEWYIEGSTVYLVDLVGDDTQFLYKYKLNASNIKRNVDATAYYTHIKGFGDYEDNGEKSSYLTDANLKLEYTHPLADLVGKREAPPVTDGRIKHKDTLIESMKAVIDNSLNITVEATLHDLRNQGYSHGIPKLGDRTFLIDERIDLKQEIRVYSIIEKYDEQDKLKDCQVDFGSQSIRKRYKANVKSIERAMQDILEGRIELPYNVLDGVAKDMLAKIKSASSELIFDDGIFAVDKTNPNLILGLNSNGLFISTDGGATADTVMTADGLVANAITSGEILTHLVRVVGTEGLFSIDGDTAKWTDANNPKRFTEISPDNITTAGTLTVLRDDGGYPFIVAGKNKIGQRLFGSSPSFTSPNVEIRGQRFQTSSNELTTVDAYYFDHFFDTVRAQLAISNYGETLYTAKIALSGFGGWNKDFSETVTVNPGGSTYISVGGYIGIPDGKEKQFYIQMASLTENRSVSMSILIVRNYDG